MSTNCILCVTNPRTGFDLLCDTCRSKQVRKCSCGQPKAKHWHLACPACWALIPKPLQDEVYHLFKTQQGSDDHVACVRRCYEAIRAAGVSEPEPCRPSAPPRDPFTIPQVSDLLARCGLIPHYAEEDPEGYDGGVTAGQVGRFNGLLNQHGREKGELQLIGERDEAEAALSQAYFLITGKSPEWSNCFGHKEALEEIDDAQRVLRQSLSAARALNEQCQCAYCGYLSPKGRQHMVEHMLTCEKHPVSLMMAEQIRERALLTQIMQEITRAVTLLGADVPLLGAIGSWGDTLSDAEVLAGIKDWCDRHDVAALDRGDVHSAYFDGDGTVGLYNALELSVEWPPSWPATVTPAALRAMGIEVRP
jgi:hypothetical protein